MALSDYTTKINWANADQDSWHFMVSLGHKNRRDKTECDNFVTQLHSLVYNTIAVNDIEGHKRKYQISFEMLFAYSLNVFSDMHHSVVFTRIHYDSKRLA